MWRETVGALYIATLDQSRNHRRGHLEGRETFLTLQLLLSM
jgi:hypothetical protein